MKITNFKYIRHVIFVGGLISMAALFSRCSASSSGSSGGGSSTTFSISGSMEVGASATSMATASAKAAKFAALDEKINSMSSGVTAQATQCNDGYYYNVYCLSYSEPPVAANGAVTCSGNSGSFTVSGLPLDTEIGCFVRRAATDTSSAYTTVGTIEIPTTSLSGGTTTLVSQGDLELAIVLADDGSITTTVTAGDDKIDSPIDNANAVDPTKYTGIWSIQCDETTVSATLFDPVSCKCRNGDSWDVAAYQPNGSKNPLVSGTPTYSDAEAACMADEASEISAADTQQYVDINMYTATPAANVPTDGGTIPAGTNVPIISVWSAMSSDASMRGSGGEGAVSSIEGVGLTWSPTSATTAIAWTTSGVHSLDDTVAVDFTAAQADFALPTSTTVTVGDWKSYVTALYDNATGFTCNWGNPVSGSTDAGCLSEFSDRVLRDVRTVNIPVIRLDRECGNGGCNSEVSSAKVYVEGYGIDYSGVSSGQNKNSMSTTLKGVSPHLKTRYVFEPFEATSTGGGFTQHEFRNRGYSCTSSGSGADVVSTPACDGVDHNWVNCGIREETAIRFKPDTSSSMKIVFESRSIVAWAMLEKWTSGNRTDGDFSVALAICESELGEASESRFQMSATK